MLSDKSLAYAIGQASMLAFLTTTIAYNCKSLYHVRSWRVPWHSAYNTQNIGLNCDIMPKETQQNDTQPNDAQQNDTLPNDTQQNYTQPYDTQQNDNKTQQNNN